MRLDLPGKTVAITGAGGGLGAGLARALRAHGAVAREVVLGREASRTSSSTRSSKLLVVDHVDLVEEDKNVRAPRPGGPAGCAPLAGASGHRSRPRPGWRRPSGRRR